MMKSKKLGRSSTEFDDSDTEQKRLENTLQLRLKKAKWNVKLTS